MGSEIEISEKLEVVMEVSPSMVEDGKPCVSPREELGYCESNREDDVFCMEGVVGVHDDGVDSRGNGEQLELEVDVVGDVIRDDGEEGVVERESQDATECSSSFGCTDSGSGTVEASGDMEVESVVHDDNVSIGFDGCSDLFKTRKKKLADDWRNYVRPLMWRCKWVELKVRELQCQASKYEKELAECDQRKHCEMENFSTEDHAIKAAPYINQNRSVKLMKRKKRRRVEETVDLTSYTSCHSLFSHFDKKKSGADTAFVNNDHCLAGTVSSGNGEFSLDDELPSLHFKDSDAFESILRTIEVAQLHVRQLRTRMDKVVKENAEKFTLDFLSSAPRGQSTSFDPNSVRPYVNCAPHPPGSMPTSTQWSSKKPPVLPGTSGSISEKATPPDIIKTIDDTKIARKCNKIDNDILICNPPVKKERQTTEDFDAQFPAGFSFEPVGKTEIIDHVPNPNLPRNVKSSQDQPTVKTQSSSKMASPQNKKKRGRRKALTGRWSKRSSG